MTDSLPPCPECAAEFTYEVDALLNCPSCGHEWSPNAGSGPTAGSDSGSDTETAIIRDAVGNILSDGDTVTVIKDLKVKGSSLVVKVGTKAKGITLVDPDQNNGHDISAKVPGMGPMGLKSSVVKKG